MERLLRNLKSEWIPTSDYMIAQEAQRDISHYLLHQLQLDQVASIQRPATTCRTPKHNLTQCPGWVAHYRNTPSIR